MKKKSFLLSALLFLTTLASSTDLWAAWNPSMTCTFTTAYSIIGTAPRDNRGIALTQDGSYLYLGFNNGPDFRRVQLNNGSNLGSNIIDRAKSIAIDDMGRVYCTGPDGNPIKIYNSTLTTLLYTIPMNKCEGIAVRRESGTLYLYATDRNLGTLSRFQLTESGNNIMGSALNGLDGDGVVAISGGSGIRGVGVGPDGKILVANPGTGIVSKLNANGSGQTDYHYAANDNPYYFAIMDGQVFVTHGNYNSGTRVAVLNYSNMSLVGNIVPPFAALGYKTTDATDMISGIAAFPDNKGFYITYEDGSAANDSYKEPVIKVVFPPVHNVNQNTYFATIQPAINASVNGDTVEVDAGTYQLASATQLIINKQITLRAKAGVATKPWIRTNMMSWTQCNVQIAADNVILDGFEIDNALYGTQTGYLVGDYGAAKNHWSIRNCNIHDAANGIRPVGNYVNIEGNDIHGTNSDCINCEYGKCGGLKVTRNILHSEWVVSGGKPAGITYNCDATAVGDVEISYNYCYACRTFVDFQHNGGTGPSNNIVIKHNTVDWKMEALPTPVTSTAIAQQMSIAFWTGSGNWDASKFSILDNIFSRQKWYAIVNTSGAAGPLVGNMELKNNLFYQWYQVDGYYPGNASPNEWPAARGAVGWNTLDAAFTFTNDIQGNPLYLGTGTSADQYYRLNCGSPAINAATDGTNIGASQINLPVVPVSIIIEASANPILPGNSVTFSATPTNGGATPAYQWKLNGTNVGSDSPLYVNATLNDNDKIKCQLTSSTACTSGNPAMSDEITMSIISNMEWTGLLNTDWNTPGNWNHNIVPTAILHALIPSVVNEPVVNQANNSPAECNNLTIENGASVTIAPGKALTVHGDLTNLGGIGGLVLQSSTDGTGSLLHNTNNVDATVERYIAGSMSLTDKVYHLVSVPISGETYASGIWMDSYLFTYLEDSNKYHAWNSPTGNTLSTKTGAMVYYQGSSKTYAITGQLNNGDFGAIVTWSGAGKGYNLIPNPYPSAIDWDAPTGWKKNNVNHVPIWGFDPVAKNYGAWNGLTSVNNVTNIIPVGQSFFVLATDNFPVLSMSNGVRVHDSKAFLKSGSQVKDILHLKATANSAQDEIAIAFKEGATIYSTDDYDAAKFYGSNKAPQLSSFSNDDASLLSINVLPYAGGTTIVPIHFEMDYTGDIVFTALGVESFYGGQPIKLEDRLLNKLVELTVNPAYTFHHEPSDRSDRFRLIFNGVTGTGEPQNEMLSSVYFVGNDLYLKYPNVKGHSKAEICNTIGQIVGQFDLLGSEMHYSLQAVPGVYFVKLCLSKGIEIHKVVKN